MKARRDVISDALDARPETGTPDTTRPAIGTQFVPSRPLDTSPNRKQVIGSALDIHSTPLPPIDRQMNIASKLMCLPPGERLPIGEVTRHLKQLPAHERTFVLNVAEKVASEEEFGARGTPREQILSAVGANNPAMERLVDHLEVERVAYQLQQRMGTDADLPIEPPSRRDILSAAFDVHAPDQE